MSSATNDFENELVRLEEALLHQAADDRTALHQGNASTCKLHDKYDEQGIAGEHAFSQRYKLFHDMSRKPRGDGGIDFLRVPLLFDVDVKCSENAYQLIVEVGTVDADIYVLAQYRGKMTNAKLLKWCWRADVLAAPHKQYSSGKINHYIDRDDPVLRKISKLDMMILRKVVDDDDIDSSVQQ